MAGETIITVVGNLTADPELRYTQSGLAVANFTIASTPRSFDRATNDWKDGEALFLRASCWREFAEHVAGSLTKGSRVYATAQVTRASSGAGGGGGRSQGAVAEEPWSTSGPAESGDVWNAPGSYSDE